MQTYVLSGLLCGFRDISYPELPSRTDRHGTVRGSSREEEEPVEEEEEEQDGRRDFGVEGAGSRMPTCA